MKGRITHRWAGGTSKVLAVPVAVIEGEQNIGNDSDASIK